MNFSEALGEALSFVEEEVTKEVIKDLELSAYLLVKDMQVSYDQFFQKLQYYILGSHIYAGEPGAPVIFSMVKAAPWKADSDDWMVRKNQAFEKDNDALDFYRGVTASLGAGKGKPKKPLRDYIEKLATDKGSSKKFFGDMSLQFVSIQPDGRERVFRSAADLKGHFHPTQSRDKKGIIRKFMDGTRLRAEITAFSKIWDVMASRDNPDMELAKFLASMDKGNAKQWFKLSGQKEWHRPAVIPLIQWYLEVEFKRLMDEYVFSGG